MPRGFEGAVLSLVCTIHGDEKVLIFCLYFPVEKLLTTSMFRNHISSSCLMYEHSLIAMCECASFLMSFLQTLIFMLHGFQSKHRAKFSRFVSQIFG